MASNTGPNTLGDIPKEKRLDQWSSSVPRPVLSRQYTVRTLNQLSPITLSTVNQAGAFNFALTQIQNAASYETVFDMYRIDYVKLEFKPTSNAIGSPAAVSTSYPALYTVIDYDDSTNLTGISAAQQYDNCMIIEAHESASRAFHPRLALPAYGGVTFNAYTNAVNVWVDVASPATLHYGVKWYLQAATAAQTLLPTWDVLLEMVVSFKCAR
jgi:hypothetical protein